VKKQLAWIDIINPPQVKYFVPIVHSLNKRGYDTLVTARDFSSTLPLLAKSGIDPIIIGKNYGSGSLFRLLNNLFRSYKLIKLLNNYPDCNFLITGSRSASLAAKFHKIPDFAFCDYEFAELKSHRLIGSRMVFPDIIPRQYFINKGFKDYQLINYRGIKEDITFAADAFQNSPIFPLPPRFSNKSIILLRPPATESHYFNSHSSSLYLFALKELSELSEIGLIFSPRYPAQIAHLDNFNWKTKPYILDNSSDMLSLLKAVDFIVSSGGTMIREAAYHNVKAISILAGNPCSVDKYLESKNLLAFARSREDFKKLISEDWSNPKPHARNHNLIQEILDQIINHVELQH